MINSISSSRAMNHMGVERGGRIVAPRAVLALGLLIAALLAVLSAHAENQNIKQVVVTVLDADGKPANFYGSLTVEVKGDYGLREWESLSISKGHAYRKVDFTFSTHVLKCMLDPRCLASHATLKIYVEPGDMFPATLEYDFAKINATISERIEGNTLYINITLPMRLNTVRFCIYTEKHAPVPGAEILSAGGVRKTGKNGCTDKPILITDKHSVIIRWGGKAWKVNISGEDFHAAVVNATLPIPFGKKFNLTIVSKDRKPLVVFVQYPGPNLPKLCNGACSFTLSDIGRAWIFFEGIGTTLTLDRIVNGTFFMLNVKAKPLKLCVYSDNDTPLTFYLDIRASYTSGLIITGSGQLSGKGCGTFYFPSIPEQIDAWASYRQGKYHLAKPFRVSVPGNYTLHLDITPPRITRAWINATWTTMYDTKCLDVLLYVQAYDPNRWASGITEVRAGFSRDFYDLMRGDYLGNNTWRFELGCPRHIGAMRTVYVAAVDKSGNREMVNFTYRVEPGVKWLLGKPPGPAASTHTTRSSETKTARASTTAPSSSPTSTITTTAIASMTTYTNTTAANTAAQTATSTAISETASKGGESTLRSVLPAIAVILLLAAALILRKKA